MHGVIFVLFNKFVRENFDFKHLYQIKKDAGLSGKFHNIGEAHPDEEIIRLITSASKNLNIEVAPLLESFGKYIGPELIKTYSSYINPEWKCLDLLENIETTMHKVVRMNTPDAAPPKLIISRLEDNKVLIEYTSKRKIIPLGVGIIKAIAEYYKETVNIEQSEIPNGTSLMITLI